MKVFIKSLAYILLTALLVTTVHAEVLVTYYHNDLLGSPVAATDENGNVLWQEEYQPYGERIENDSASQLNRQWYTGKQLDKETDLTYLGARYYDQNIGRFMGIDPIDFVADNPHSFNRYAYASNNPYKYIDPNGEAVETVFDVASFSISVGLFVADPSIGNALGVIVDGAAAVIPFVPGGVGVIRSAGKGADAVGGVAKGAKDPDAIKLEKKLASQEQLGQLSEGGGTVIGQPATQANRIASETGLDPAKIQKVSSDQRIASDGTKIQTKTFRDADTNKLIQPKTEFRKSDK